MRRAVGVVTCPDCSANTHPNTTKTQSGSVNAVHCSYCETSYIEVGELIVSVHDEGHAQLETPEGVEITSDDLFAAVALLRSLGASKEAEETNERAWKLAGEAEYRATPKHLRREYQPNF